MRYIPTTIDLVEQFKEAAKKAKRSTKLTQADALRGIANAHGYDHWGHVMWCLKETNERIANGFNVKADLIDPKELSFLKEVEYIIGLAELREDTLVCLKTCLLFSTTEGDAWLLDVETNRALCLCWRGNRQPFAIAESADSFAVQYDSEFAIDGDAFGVSSDNPSIGRRTILCAYPTQQIIELAERFRRHAS